MPRRKPPYPDKPYTPSQTTAEKFRAFMPPKKQKELKPEWLEPKGGWQLWDWRTLEDAKQT